MAMFTVVIVHDAFDGEIESVFEKEISTYIKPLFALCDRVDGICKLGWLHYWECSGFVYLCQEMKVGRYAGHSS